MADQQYEPFSGKLDAAPEFVPFDGTLDGEKPKPRGAIRAMADLGVGVASGVVGVSKAAANAAGAGNTVSNVLDSADKTVQGWLSPQAQADQQEIAAHMSDAKAKGLNLEGVKAGAKAFATAPGQFAAQAVGSAAPFIASALTGPLLPTALGVAVGMGTSKGSIYDEIKKRGGTEEEAIKAQEYGGPNKDQIALGGALGVADALTGVAGAGGRMLRGALRKPVANAAVDAVQTGAIRRMATGVASEAPLEAVQGGQEQVAANMAAQRAGYEAGTWDNVASNATLEALASAGPGAAFGLADKAPAAVKPPANTEDVGGSAGQGLAGTEPTRVEAMGINPVGGPLQAAAAMAVDSGAHDVEIAKQAAQTALDEKSQSSPGDRKQSDSPTGSDTGAPGPLASSQSQQLVLPGEVQSGGASANPTPANVNPATGEIGGAFDQREADRPKTQPGDIAEFVGQPITNAVMAGRAAASKSKETGDKYAPVQLGTRQFVIRKQENTDAPTSTPTATSAPAQADAQPAEAGRLPEMQPAASGVPVETGAAQPGNDALTESPIDAEIANLKRIEAINIRQNLGLNTKGMASDNLIKSGRLGEVDNDKNPAPATEIKVPERTRYLVTKSPAYDGVEPLSAEDAEFELEALENSANKGRLTPAVFAGSEIGKRLDAGTIIGLQTSLKSDPVGTIQALRKHIANKQAANVQNPAPAANQPAQSQESQDAGPNKVGRKDSAQIAQPVPGAGSGAVQAVDEAAHAAATSPLNDLPQPTDAQKKAGNYAKGHVMLGGLDLSIENPAGSVRSGKDKTGKAWSNTLQHHYGYIKGTMGNDKDHVDLFVKPETPLDYSGDVYVIDQVHPETGKFDEHKVMVGFPNALSAKAAYHKNYAKGWKGMKAMTPMPFSEFKAWVKDGPKNKPLAPESIAQPATKPVATSKADSANQEKKNLWLKAINDQNRLAGDTGVQLSVTADGKLTFLGVPNATKQGRALAATLDEALNAGASRADVIASIQAAKTQPTEKPSDQAPKAEQSQTQPEAGKAAADIQPAASPGVGGKAEGVEEPNFQAAKNLLAQQKAATGNAVAEGAIRKKLRDLAAKTPISDAKTVSALDIAATRLGMGEGKLKGLEFAPAAAPVSNTQTADAPELSESTKARNLLMELQAKQDANGMVGDDRLETQINQIKREIAKLDGQNDELDAEMQSYEAKANPTYSGGPKSEQKVPEAQTNIAPAATETIATPDAKTALSEREKAAKAKMFNALGKLAHLAGKNTRMNWTQEEEQQLLPIVIELFDGAMELGAVTFQQAVAYVRDFITTNLDSETADAIPFDTLQGAYISVAGRHKDKGVTSKKEVVGFESLDELENSTDKADTAAKETQNDSGTEKQGSGALDGVSSGKVGGTGSGGSGGRGAKSGSTRRRKGNSSTDGKRGTPGRSGGDSAADADSSSTGGTGGGRGIEGNGSGVPANGGSPDVKLDAGSGRGVPKGQDGLFTESGEVIPAAVPAANFTITPDLKLGSGGEVTKYKDNIAAIRALKLIESEHRRATAEEQRVLARYVGWGGLANAFRNRVTGAVKADWANEVAELESLLTAKELKAASASTPNAHYTSETVTGFMWRAAKRLGFSGGMVLEPSVGSGNFIGMMPEIMRRGTYLTGIELDSITARIAGALYPQSNIVQSGFEKVALPDNTFDLNIGNPPFGQISLRMQYNPKHNGKSIHNQFFLGSMDALKPGGIQAMVVSRYLMDAQDASTREALALKAELLGAIRLPGSAFKGNAGTDVVTDILFLRKRSTVEQTELQDLWNSRGAKVPAKESYADRAARLAGQARLAQALDWTTTAKIPDPLGGEAMQISKYFADNPQMVAGVMDRSGSMQFGGDIDVKLPASELAAKLDSLMEFLPGVKGEFRSDEVNAKTEEMHRALGESMSIMASGREIGSIYYDESGALTEIVERVGVDGKTIVSKNTIDASTPWSSQLSMNMEGKWFKEVAQLDEKGEKVKVGRRLNPKTGKLTVGRNVWVREVFANESDVPSGMRLGEEGFAKLKKLVGIRELYVEQINLETNSAQTEPMEANRAKLRAAYEAFVADHGYISEQKNAAIISEMPDEGLMLSLELKFRPAVTLSAAVKRGIKPSAARAEQNAILTRAVAIPPERKNNASSVSDAVAIVLGETGRIDVARVAELRGVTEDEALAELTGGDSPLAYMDPETNEVTEKNQYLSGNVRKKMVAARDAGLKRNFDALMKVQPEPWTSDKVTAHMGASWIPPEVYANFVKSLLGRDATATFSQLSNTFEVSAPGSTAIDTSKWGTGRLPAVELLNDVLNSRRIAIYDGGGKDSPRVLNEIETQSAIDKKKEIIEEFDNWIFKDGDRRQELTRLFNDKYNILVNRQYDGSHMDFPGKVPDSIIAFRRNQINAIWRGIVDRFTMYDHAVGAGKTFTGIARAMERKRMGLSNKPTIVVPNHLVSEWATQAYRLYPGAKILAAGAKDLEPKNRRRLFAKIAAGDWDLVIVPHSSFKFIGISPETEERFINDELRVAQDALKEAEDDAEPGQRFKPLSVKAAEALILKLENRMDVVRGKAGKDQLLTFEQMGIDDLTVDEAHEFKNLTYSTKLTDVRGLGPAAGSQKAFDLYTKMRILHETNGSAVFLTGTPISNSAVEMYTIMRYLAPDVLRESGLEHFDAFRAQYVQATEKPEPTEAGDGLKVVNRLGRNWSNMRSLMDGYYSVADVVTNDDIKAWFAEDNPGKVFPLPNVKGGGRRTVVAKPTPTQQELIDELIAGYNGLPNIEDVKERNIARLRLMDKARKLALHAKVWDRTLTDEPGGKLDKVVDESFRLYKAFSAEKGTQLIFLDRSVPKAQGDDKQIKDYDALRAKLTEANANGDEDVQREAIEALEKFDSQEIDELRAAQAGGWNAYQHMADGLIAKGVPKEQIAFIQNFTTDAQKKALFEAVNDGTIRFLFGSSQRMGAGMNVQERLVGLHHVDVTWKPSDIEQREGRIIRQGNLFFTPPTADNPNPLYRADFEVEIIAYVTERSIDAKMWDLNSTKLRMVNGIRYYDGEFEMDFDDDAAIDMAEIAAIASGDPLMLERIKVNTVIEELYRKRRSYNRRVESAGDSLRRAERDVETLPGEIAKKKALMAPIDDAFQKANSDQYSRRVMVGDKEFRSLEQALKHAEETILIAKEGDSKRPFALDVDGESFKSEAGVQDAIAEKMGDVSSFVAEIDGKKVIRRTAVARELRRLIGSEFTDISTTPVGTLYGFPLSMKTEKTKFGSFVDLSVKVPYEGGVETIAIAYDLTPEKHTKGTTVTVLTSTLRAALERLVDKMDSIRTDVYGIEYMQRNLKEATENIPTYREAVKEQFKQADELDEALTRLDDIQSQLQARADAASAAPAASVADDDAVAFSRPKFSRGAQSQANESVTRLANGIASHWENAPKVVVAFDMNDPIIPENVRKEDQRQRSGGATGTPEGFYYKGTVYLMSSKVKTANDVARVLAHETLGHYGLRGMFGDALTPILRQIAHMRKDQVRAKAIQYGLKGITDLDRRTAAEEVLAEMAQNTPEIGFVRRAIAAIRTWLRRNVPGFKSIGMTDDEIIRSYIIPARNWVERGAKAETATGMVPAFGRESISSLDSATVKRIGDKWAAVRFEGTGNESHISYHATEQQARDAATANDSKRRLEADTRAGKFAGWWTVDGGTQSFRDESIRGNDAVATGRAIRQTLDSRVRAVKTTAEGRNLQQIPSREGFCYKCAAEAAMSGIGDYVIGESHDGTNPVWHAVIMRDGMVYDPTFGKWFAPGIYEKLGFKEALRLTPQQVRDYLDQTGGLHPNARNQGLGDAPGDVPMFSRSIGDTLKNITVTDIKARTGNKLADYRGLGLQFLGGRQIVDLYGKDLPQLGRYTQMVQQMSADANEVGAQADGIATGWSKLTDERQLAELMHDATLAQIDPAKEFVTGDNRLQWGKLNADYKALSPEAKTVYTQARDAYEEHYAQVREAIRDKIERSEMSSASKAAMLERMDGEFFDKIKGVYFPLARFGKYVVVTRGPAGVVNVSRAETLNEAEALRTQMRAAYPSADGFTVGKVIKDKEFNASRDSVGRGFLKELFGVLDEKGMGEELQDAVNQLYLASMPDLSWAKHGIHRKGTPGFSQDARRAFAQNMFHGARYLAKLRYADQLQDKLIGMQNYVESQANVEAFDSVKAQQVVDELNKRHDSLMNPKSNPLSTALTSFGFVFHMGLSPASAMVNLSGTAMVAYPIMGAKWGFDKAAGALLKAGKEAATHKNDISAALNGDEKRAYDAAVKAGTIDVTAAHDLAGIAQGEDAGVMWKMRPVMKWASFLFHHAERFNRQVTFVAAYRLARETGVRHEVAFEQATKATYDGHFDYASSNRPRVMQGNAAKVILLFKQYSQNMVYTIARQAQLAMKAETPQERKEARKALGGLLVMHAAGAGVLGLPLVGTLLAAASMLGGSDDEPWDAEVALRNMLADAFGQKPAEVMARGFSRLTPWDISGRVGLDKLILPDIQEGLEGQRLGESAMAAALGPVAGIGINVLKGMQEISEGHMARGLESMMPAALRGPMKALRYEQEGAKDKTGVVIQDEVSLAGIAGQALGFSPSDVRNSTEGRSAIYNADKRLMQRRSELMRQFADAFMAKDQERVASVRQEIQAFNEKNPNRRIGGMQLMQSVRARNKRVDESQDGVYLPKKRRDAIEEGRFAVAD